MTVSDSPRGQHRLDNAGTSSLPRETHDDDGSTAEHGDTGGFPILKAVLFVVGCVLLVVAAATLMHLSEWSQRWGVIPVFLGFFLVMSIAGRWFWAGADALLGALMWGTKK